MWVILAALLGAGCLGPLSEGSNATLEVPPVQDEVTASYVWGDRHLDLQIEPVQMMADVSGFQDAWAIKQQPDEHQETLSGGDSDTTYLHPICPGQERTWAGGYLAAERYSLGTAFKISGLAFLAHAGQELPVANESIRSAIRLENPSQGIGWQDSVLDAGVESQYQGVTFISVALSEAKMFTVIEEGGEYYAASVTVFDGHAVPKEVQLLPDRAHWTRDTVQTSEVETAPCPERSVEMKPLEKRPDEVDSRFAISLEDALVAANDSTLYPRLAAQLADPDARLVHWRYTGVPPGPSMHDKAWLFRISGSENVTGNCGIRPYTGVRSVDREQIRCNEVDDPLEGQLSLVEKRVSTGEILDAYQRVSSEELGMFEIQLRHRSNAWATVERPDQSGFNVNLSTGDIPRAYGGTIVEDMVVPR